MNAQTPAVVIEHEPSREVTPLTLLDRALSMNLDPGTLKEMMQLQREHRADRARMAFDAAMAAAKAEIPVIRKNRKVGFEHKSGGDKTEYRHEDLGEIARTVDPILGKHGLSYRFRTNAEPNAPVTVTCIIAHRDGHSEENTLSAGRDDSGKKNAIQQIGSAITYLQRYTLKAALGLAAAADDDGHASEAPATISDAQVAELQRKIVRTGTDLRKFLARFVVDSLEDLTPAQADRANIMLDAKIAAEAKAETEAAA